MTAAGLDTGRLPSVGRVVGTFGTLLSLASGCGDFGGVKCKICGFQTRRPSRGLRQLVVCWLLILDFVVVVFGWMAGVDGGRLAVMTWCDNIA